MAKHRADYAGRNEPEARYLMVRMSVGERAELKKKAERAGIAPRGGSDGPNLAAAVRTAIEAWKPGDPAPAAEPKKMKRVFVNG